MLPRKPFIVGIAGASGAGKSTLTDKIQHSLKQSAAVLLQDNFYRDLSDCPLQQRAMVNFDHPDAVEFDLFFSLLYDLKQGKEISIPLYDFTKHNRRKVKLQIKPQDIIIVEGTLIFAVKNLRQLFDVKIFIDTPLDICFIRRLTRDCRQRGRSVDSVVTQYISTVRPMYLKYIKPSRKYADLIVDCSTAPSERTLRQIFRHIENR